MKLGVNIDHIATIRQARMTDEPDPVFAAVQAELAGADGITIHIRQDRRHIQERDLRLLMEVVKTRLNVEMAASDEMAQMMLKYKPVTCTLVPENPDEVTTTGGLDVINNEKRVKKVAAQLEKEGIEVSIFIDPDLDQIGHCHALGLHVIELNTGEYAENWNNTLALDMLERLRRAAGFAGEKGFKVLAGHGLTYRNIQPIVTIPEIEELNIGHSIIANATFWGLTEAVRRMKELIK